MYLVLCEKQNNYDEECRVSCSCGAATCRPKNGTWETSGWSACSKSCGGGTQTRSASCVGASCGGNCGDKPTTSRSCNTQPCCSPADGSCGGSGWGSSPYGSACEANSWVAAGYCGGSDQRCYTPKPAVTGAAGSAANKIFVDTANNYGGFTQCASGTSSNTAFPAKGGSVIWYCQGFCGGANSGPHTAYRNRYPTFYDTVCPTGYEKSACGGRDGKDCNQPAKTCVNPAACLTQELDYSENFVDKKAICYLPKTCDETNPAVNGNHYSEVKPNNPPYQIITGLANGNSQTCYRKKECSEIEDSDLQKELANDSYTQNQGLKFPYQTSDCMSTATNKYLSLPTGYSNGSNDANCNVCIKVSDPWFQVVNGNLYANGDIKGSNTGKANVYEVRGADCSNNGDKGVGIPVSSSQIRSLSSQIGNSKDVNLSPGAVTVDKEDYDFFVKSLGYLPEELKDNIKACPNNLNSHNSNDFTDKDGNLICYEDGNLTLNSPLAIGQTEIKIIFVNGNLELKAQTQVASGGLLLFVVSGNVVINPSLGHFPIPSDLASADTSSCINPDEATIDLHGIFIADGTISIASGAGADNQSNYWHGFTSATDNQVKNGQGASCDKKLTLKGSFIGWGQTDSSSTTGTLSSTKKGILISRTFAGCIKGFTHTDLTTPYTSYLYDFNGSIPVVTFVYDINLIKAMPAWTQVSARLRQEVK